MSYAVMAGLVAAIHDFLPYIQQDEDVDARHKAGHDGENFFPSPPNSGSPVEVG